MNLQPISLNVSDKINNMSMLCFHTFIFYEHTGKASDPAPAYLHMATQTIVIFKGEEIN